MRPTPREMSAGRATRLRWALPIIFASVLLAQTSGVRGGTPTLDSAIPPHDGTLWRTSNNTIRLVFVFATIVAPTAGDVEINELLSGGGFGPDLSSGFTFTVEGGFTLRIRDTSTADFVSGKWYAIQNTGGWSGVAPFEVHYFVRPGDAEGDGTTQYADASEVNAGVPCISGCGDANRRDMDGNGNVVNADTSFVFARVFAFKTPKPSGHRGVPRAGDSLLRGEPAPVTFTPVGPTTVPAGTSVQFDVSVTVSMLAQFDSADLLIGFNGDGFFSPFGFESAWVADSTNSNAVTNPVPGVYTTEIIAGGFRSAGYGTTRDIGTVTIDTFKLPPGTYTLSVDPDLELAVFGANISKLSLLGNTEVAAGSTTFTIEAACISDPPACCHLPDDGGNAPAGERGFFITAADDFVPSVSQISTITWWGVYLHFPVTPPGCGPGTGDDFRVRIYDDAGGLPGSLVATRFLSPTKTVTGVLFGQYDEYEYVAQLGTPISVSSGQCYWMEITNSSASTDCYWFWSPGTAGNAHAVQNIDNGIYESSDRIYINDLAFCIDGPIAANDCGDVLGQCCGPAAGNCITSTQSGCLGGRWRLGGSCTPNPCAIPANNACAAASPIADGEIEYDTWFATTDGPSSTLCETGDTSITADVWFRYTATCNGTLTVSLCNETNQVDPIVAIYGDETPTCSCPPTSSLRSCADDNCVLNPVFSSSRPIATTAVVQGNCYLLRIGGHSGPPGTSSGYGKIEITCQTPVIFVDASATGANDGSSWANAHRYLRDAIGPHNREVWVAAGTYRPDRADFVGPAIPGDRSNTFQLLSGQPIYGGFNGTETLRSQRNPALNPTILSGDLLGNDAPVACTQNSPDCDSFGFLCVGGACIIKNNNVENSYHVINGSVTDATAVLDGFTISEGNANGGSIADRLGAGVYNDNGSPTVNNCTFSSNIALDQGGGMFNRNNSNPTVNNCTFRGNWGDRGGGLKNVNSSPIVTNCVFARNAAIDGGGVHNSLGDPTITNCVLNGNFAVTGAGMWNDSNSSPNITGCAFNGNSGGNDAGGIYNDNNSSPAMTNCTFSGNSVNINGGAILNVTNSNPTIINCTLSENSSGTSGGGIYNADNSSPLLTNCVLWGNSDSGGIDESAQIHTVSGTPVVNYSIVQGAWTGAGSNNSSADPLFVNPNGPDNIVGTLDDDLRLRAGSPAIDRGDNAAVPMDALDLDGDGNTAEPIPFDLAGNSRFFDDPATIPSFPVVDMGAYEFFTDCNNNGVPDSTDIAMGTSQDCNQNGLPDECDIAACAGSPACDDCNLNGVLDSCDIAFGTSLDVTSPFNVPDECAEFTDACTLPGQEQFWTCADNWPLSGQYPDNIDSAANIYVTLPGGDTVFLDQDVTIPALRVAAAADLRITQGGAEGDLDFSSPAHFDIRGTVLVSSSRTIGAGGAQRPDVTITSGGTYQKDAAAVASPGSTTAALFADSVTVSSGDSVVPCAGSGGRMELSDAMSVTTTGDFVIDGAGACGACESSQFAARGGHTPPVVRIRNQGTLTVGGTMALASAANVIVNSSSPVTIGGNFENNSRRSDCFFCSTGGFRMTGNSRLFEVAATDIGSLPDLSSAQYVMGNLEIASGAAVTFRDSFDNDATGQGACSEALYVDTLTLDAGSSITLDNCHVYFQTLVRSPSATVTTLGCADLQQVSCSFTQPVAPEPEPIAKNRYLSFLPSNAGRQTALRVTLVSLQHPDPPNLPQFPPLDFAALESHVRWVGVPNDCVETQTPPSTFKCATLVCQPQYLDWPAATAGQTLHVTGVEVVPSSVYRVESIAQGCAVTEEFNYSAPLIINTARWGDIIAPFQAAAPAPLSQPNITDVVGVVDKFKGLPSAVIVARSDLQPGLPNFTVNISDVASTIDAFKSMAYLYAMSPGCP